jgi:hypothetical protein
VHSKQTLCCSLSERRPLDKRMESDAFVRRQGMTQTDQGYFVYDQVFQRAEMVDVVDALAAARLERTKACCTLNTPQPSILARASR